MNLKKQQEKFLSLILSIIGLSIEISIIANIIFTVLFENNKFYFIISITIITLINIILILQINTKYCKVSYTYNLPLVFDSMQNKFIDIPHCPSSVNARLLFDSLSTKQKKSVIQDNPLENIEYSLFCVSFIGQLIFSRIFSNSSQHILDEKNGLIVDREYFRDLLAKYKYVDIEDILNKYSEDYPKLLALPKGIKISKVTNNEIMLQSLQGYIRFDWIITTKFPCDDKISLLAKSGKINISTCFSSNIQISLNYGYNILNLFKNKTKILDEYFSECKKVLESFDIANNMQELQLELSSLHLDIFHQLTEQHKI